MTYADIHAAAQALHAGTASLEDLRDIVVRFPGLRGAVAEYPPTDPPLLEWLASLNDPAVAAALLRRAQGASARQSDTQPDPSQAPTQIGAFVAATIIGTPATPLGAATAGTAASGTAASGAAAAGPMSGVAASTVMSGAPLGAAGTGVAAGTGIASGTATSGAIAGGVAAGGSPAVGTALAGAASKGGMSLLAKAAIGGLAVATVGTGTFFAAPAIINSVSGGPTEGIVQIVGPPAGPSVWANGYTEKWTINPGADVLRIEPAATIDYTQFDARNGSRVVFQSGHYMTAGLKLHLGYDLDTGRNVWDAHAGPYVSCSSLDDKKMHCMGGRQGHYPTSLISYADGKSTSVTADSLGFNFYMDAEKLFPNENEYGWGISSIGGRTVAHWHELDKTMGHTGLLKEDGSGFVWKSDRPYVETSPDIQPGVDPDRIHHDILTAADTSFDMKTGAVLRGTAWLADNVVKGDGDGSTFAAPDGTKIAVARDGVFASSLELPKYPLRVNGSHLESIDAFSSGSPTRWSITLPSSTQKHPVVAARNGVLAILTGSSFTSSQAQLMLVSEADGRVIGQGQFNPNKSSARSFHTVGFTKDGSVVVNWHDSDDGYALGHLALYDGAAKLLWQRPGNLQGMHSASRYDHLLIRTSAVPGTYALLVPKKGEKASVAPSGAPACPSGMTAASWTKYADGSVLVCRQDDKYWARIDDGNRRWKPSTIEFKSGTFVLTFANGATFTPTLGGRACAFFEQGNTKSYVAKQAWDVVSGEVTNLLPDLKKQCPAGSWPISQSTWNQGWLLVCGTDATATALYYHDTELGDGEATSSIEATKGRYCATVNNRKVCANAAPAVATFVSGTTTVQRSVSDNWFPEIQQGGAGKGTGAYQVPAPADTAQDQVRYLVAILERSTAARAKLMPAITTVQKCSNVQGGIDEIKGVGQNRRDLLTALDSTPVDKIPNGTALIAQLREALEKSRDADDAWQR